MQQILKLKDNPENPAHDVVFNPNTRIYLEIINRSQIPLEYTVRNY